MKKLLIAAALTASVCSFGETVAPLNAQTFEGTAVGTKPAEIEEAAGNVNVKYFKADGGDASAVAAYADAEGTASTQTPVAGVAGNNFLSLSTEGSTLWRTINPYTFETSTTTDENGEEETTVTETTATKAAAATGTYIDTLVQFTATEEDPTTIDTDAKLAMWLLKTGEGETANYTLKVQGLQVTSYNIEEMTPVIGDDLAYTLNTGSIKVKPGEWYRLTVKAVTVFEFAGAAKIAFAIYIDGNLVKPVETAVTSEWITTFSSQLKSGVEALLTSNSLIPSATFNTGSADTLYGVGFKGTGAIDSIAWTDEDIYPFSAPSAAFTLTIAMDETSIDSVTYTFGEGDAAVTATVKADTDNIEVPENAVVKFTAVAKDWFTAPTIADITMTANTTTPEIKGVAVTASDITFTDTTVPADAATAALAWAKNVAGKTTDQVKAAKYFYSDYLLGFTDFSEAEPTIEIVSIDFDADGKPVVEAKVTVDGVTKIEKLSTATLNGTLKYKAAATLEALKTATPKDAIGAGDQFIQVVVE